MTEIKPDSDNGFRDSLDLGRSRCQKQIDKQLRISQGIFKTPHPLCRGLFKRCEFEMLISISS